jgi:hypothetical protein
MHLMFETCPSQCIATLNVREIFCAYILLVQARV